MASQTTRPSCVLHVWLPFFFYITFKLFILGFQRPLFMKVYLPSHLPFWASKLDWSLSETIQNGSDIGCLVPSSEPIPLLSFPYWISVSFLFRVDFSKHQITTCSSQIQQILLSKWLLMDEDSGASQPVQGHTCRQRRMEPAVHLSLKAKPTRIYLQANDSLKSRLQVKAKSNCLWHLHFTVQLSDQTPDSKTYVSHINTFIYK